MLGAFVIGDEVTYFKPSASKKIAKITPKQRGPYKVVEVHPSGVDYTITRIGSKNKRDRLKVHVDPLKMMRRFKEDGGEPEGTHQSKPAAIEKSGKYVVQEICGERETGSNQRQYLIK